MVYFKNKKETFTNLASAFLNSRRLVLIQWEYGFVFVNAQRQEKILVVFDWRSSMLICFKKKLSEMSTELVSAHRSPLCVQVDSIATLAVLVEEVPWWFVSKKGFHEFGFGPSKLPWRSNVFNARFSETIGSLWLRSRRLRHKRAPRYFQLRPLWIHTVVHVFETHTLQIPP